MGNTDAHANTQYEVQNLSSQNVKYVEIVNKDNPEIKGRTAPIPQCEIAKTHCGRDSTGRVKGKVTAVLADGTTFTCTVGLTARECTDHLQITDKGIKVNGVLRTA